MNGPDLSTRVESLGLQERTITSLSDQGLLTLQDLCASSEPELLMLNRIGRISVNDIKEALARMGLTLRKATRTAA